MTSKLAGIVLLNLLFIGIVSAAGSNGNCTFNNGLCKWFNAASGDSFDWTRHRGSTGSAGTGPEGDANGNGWYLYIETSQPRKKGETANLNLANLVGVYCMKFKYNMYGSQIGDLQIFMLENGPVGQTFVWAKYGNQGPGWKKGNVTVYGFSYSIIVSARVGGGYTGDIAFDDVTFVPGTCYDNEDPEALLMRRVGGDNSTNTEIKGSCDFNSDTCGWSQDVMEDQFDWSVGKGKTSTGNTGPSGGHGKKGGQYLFIESSTPQRYRNKARLLSPQLCGQVCMRFYYHMFGSTMGKLSVFRKDGIQAGADRLWYKERNQGDQWNRAIVEVNSDQDCYQVIMEGEVGSSYYSDIAIDDIYIQKGSCCNMKSELNTLEMTGNCDFKKNFCGWKNLKIDDFDWNIGKGPTPSEFTGPKSGYKKDGYVYIEASEPRFVGDTAIMASGVLLGSMCMRFRYHMFGEEIGSLSVFRNGDGVMQQLLWQQDGNQGDIWHEAEFFIDCNVTSYQVEIEATVGGWRGDIAVDEITFTPGSCPPKPVIVVDHNNTGPVINAGPKAPEFNGFCTFGTSFCGWKNDLDEDFFDWKRNSGKTPSENTGPNDDYSGEGYYIFIESSDRKAGEFARLVSGSLQDTHCLKFQYHMYGDGIGDLRVEVKDSDNAYLWNTTWSKSGSQGKFWNPASVTVTGYDYVVGISAVRGSSYLGDIAIDSINILKGPCKGNNKDGFFVDARKKLKLVDCSFDTKELCKGWKNDHNANFKWSMYRLSTPSSGTGPEKDVSGNGFYAYIEASAPRVRNDVARIFAYVPIKVCMSFFYNMNGGGTGTLRIRQQKRKGPMKTIWKKQGHQGRDWFKQSVYIKGDEGVRVLIEGVVGNSYQSDIAIDQISFKQGHCPPGS